MNTSTHGLQQLADGWYAWITAASWQLALVVTVVAAAVWLLRNTSPRLRHALWLLVLVKVFLPPSLAASWSLVNWPGVRTVSEQAMSLALPANATAGEPGAAESQPTDPTGGDEIAGRAGLSTTMLLGGVWLVGAGAFFGLVGWRYASILRQLGESTRIDEGPARVQLERVALELGSGRVPELHALDHCSSPFLLGVLRPRIVLPQLLVARLDEDSLRTVLRHELIHYLRRDHWIGWLQVVAQGLFWFHPFLWWANRQLRCERECVCDAAVLSQGHCTPRDYWETIFQVLATSRGRSLAAGSLVGVFERGANLQQRVEAIMNYEPTRHGFGWISKLAVLAFAMLLLPMAPTASEVAAGDDASPAGVELPASTVPQGPWPLIASSTPAIGATDVDPGIEAITVTFDRDMSTGGYSWTGDGPLFPPVDKTRKPQWLNERTCSLPVKLEKGAYYRVGINSTSYQNFRGADGTPAKPASIYFVTKGASRAVERRVKAPEIKEMEPANGATDVDPATDELRVTFDMPMGGGMSWTGGGDNFPESVEGQRAHWLRDGRTCVLPVKLEPGRTYRLGINSPSHINFQSKWGVQIEAVGYTFTTAEE